MKNIKLIIIPITLMLIISCSICDKETPTDNLDEQVEIHLLGEYISAIECDSDNNVLIGVEYPGTIYKYYGDSIFIKTNIDNFEIREMFITSNDVIYAMRLDYYLYPDSSLIRSSDGGDTWDIVDLQGESFLSLIETKYKALVGGAHKSVYYSLNGVDWTNILLPLIDNEHKFANQVNIDGNGNLWIEMKGGMMSYLLKYNLVTSEYKYYGRISHANRILISDENDVFIAHQAHDEASGGVSRVLANIDTVEFLPMISKYDIGLVISNLEFYNTGIIAATEEGIKFSNDKCESWSQFMPDSFFSAVAVDKRDIVYAGTGNGTFIKIENIDNLFY